MMASRSGPVAGENRCTRSSRPAAGSRDRCNSAQVPSIVADSSAGPSDTRENVTTSTSPTARGTCRPPRVTGVRSAACRSSTAATAADSAVGSTRTAQRSTTAWFQCR